MQKKITVINNSKNSLCIQHILLYRYWRNTRIFPFTKKSYLQRAQWWYFFYLSHVRILVSPCLLTSKPITRELPAQVTKYYCPYFSFITLYPSFITFLWQAFCDRWPIFIFNYTILLFWNWIKKSNVFYVGISSVSIK